MTTISDEPFEMCDDPRDAWNGAAARGQLFEEYVELLGKTRWSKFITLTFKDPISPEQARGFLRRLVRLLNKELLGRHYGPKVGHSYFSCAPVVERQARGACHIHLLVDRPVHSGLIEQLAHRWGGKADISAVRDQIASTKYVCKTILTGGEIEVPWFAKPEFVPVRLPYWWAE